MWGLGGQKVDDQFFNEIAKNIPVQIVEAKEGTTKEFKQYCEIHLQVIDGPFEGRLFPPIKFFNTPPSEGKKGTLWRMKSLASACKMYSIIDGEKILDNFTAEGLIGKIFVCDTVPQYLNTKYIDIANFREYNQETMDFNQEVSKAIEESQKKDPFDEFKI